MSYLSNFVKVIKNFNIKSFILQEIKNYISYKFGNKQTVILRFQQENYPTVGVSRTRKNQRNRKRKMKRLLKRARRERWNEFPVQFSQWWKITILCSCYLIQTKNKQKTENDIKEAVDEEKYCVIFCN